MAHKESETIAHHGPGASQCWGHSKRESEAGGSVREPSHTHRRELSGTSTAAKQPSSFLLMASVFIGHIW